VAGIDGIALSGDSEVTLAATETRLIPVRVRVPHGQGRPGSNHISFRLQGLDGARSQVNEKAVFYIPR
jgi:hypothetical protein